ncbi:MAG: hypothetical protein MJY47_04475 [Fibrobacter sp.]|nr:hypothetical protein [Fibrobacter sp.]
MNMTIKKTLIALLAATAASSATVVRDNQNVLTSKEDSINAKRGFVIDGSIRAAAQASYFDNDQDPSGLNKMPETERNEFVTADIDFHFRPYEAVRANAMLRLGGGMQEYFAAASKTASVAWINVEGNIGKSFYWIIGDFRQEYSPLTLTLPGLDIMYEPTIFARKRHMAQKEPLIEGSQRNLQGVNVQFRKELNPALGEVRAEALMARLNRTAVLDFTGAEGNLQPGMGIAGATQASNMDKWLAAGNFEILPMSKNLYVGLTPMYIFDNEKSFSYTYRHPGNDLNSPYQRQAINPYDTDAQETMVFSGRVGADVAGMAGSKTLVMDVVAEAALSKDKVYHHAPYAVLDEAGNQIVDELGNPVMGDAVTDETLDGMAILGTLNAGYQKEAWSAILKADVIYNDSNWFNNAAQSPSFFAQRILNSDKDGNTVRYGVNSPLYSTFDAVYNFSPKFSPVTTTLGTDDNAIAGGQTESYNIANYNKNSWGTNVYTHSQLALLETLMDPAVQLALPFGLATPNRLGAQATATFNMSEKVEVQGLFSMFNQVKAVAGFDKAAYTEYGGGAKWDIFKTFGITNRPLEISGSYKHSERSIDFDPTVGAGTAEIKSDFINGGLYVQYLPRLGFAAGVQMITTEYNDVQASISGWSAPMMKSTQMQWMAGVDYTVAENAWLAINFGMISVKNEYNTANLVAAGSSAGAENLPNYYDVSKDASGSFEHEFSQTIVEASINVEF